MLCWPSLARRPRTRTTLSAPFAPAWRSSAAARDYAADIDRQYGVDFQVPVGIHTGLAVLDRVGDRIRAEYTAMGDTPNVAARMQSACRARHRPGERRSLTD
jgi:class 3 adenylate cyclase